MATESCTVCGRDVRLTSRGWCREVSGWEEVRKGGGANKIMRRKTTGKVAHYSCLTDELERQEALF